MGLILKIIRKVRDAIAIAAVAIYLGLVELIKDFKKVLYEHKN